MSTEPTPDTVAFLRMAREFPLRTAIYTFGLPLFGVLQLINGVAHGGSLLFIGAFVTLAVVHSVLLTHYHVSVYRRKRLTR